MEDTSSVTTITGKFKVEFMVVVNESKLDDCAQVCKQLCAKMHPFRSIGNDKKCAIVYYYDIGSYSKNKTDVKRMAAVLQKYDIFVAAVEIKCSIENEGVPIENYDDESDTYFETIYTVGSGHDYEKFKELCDISGLIAVKYDDHYCAHWLSNAGSLNTVVHSKKLMNMFAENGIEVKKIKYWFVCEFKSIPV